MSGEFVLSGKVTVDTGTSAAQLGELKSGVAGVADAERATVPAAAAAAQAQEALARAQRSVTASAGQQRAGMQQLGLQFGDFTQQVSLGINPVVAFGQQAGQAAYAASMMGGAVGKVGAFFVGPWGAIILAATTVLGTMAVTMLSAGDASEKTGKGHKHQADAAKTLTEALTDLDRVSGASHKNAQQLLADSIAAARANVLEEISVRNKVKARLEGVLALQRAGEGAVGHSGEAAALNAPILAAKAADIQRDLDRQDGLITAAQARIAVDKGIFAATEKAAAATSVSAAATQKYEREVARLTDAFKAHRITQEQLTTGLIAAKTAEDAANNAKRDAAKVQREQSKESRDAARDAKALASENIGLVASYGDLSKAAAEYSKALADIGKAEARGLIAPAEAGRARQRAEDSKLDTLGLPRATLDELKANSADFGRSIMKGITDLDAADDLGKKIGKHSAQQFSRDGLEAARAIGDVIGGHAGAKIAGGLAIVNGGGAAAGIASIFGGKDSPAAKSFQAGIDRVIDPLKASVLKPLKTGIDKLLGGTGDGASLGAIAGGGAAGYGLGQTAASLLGLHGAAKGALVGAGTGAGIGAVAGGPVGAAIGAAVGATIGALSSALKKTPTGSAVVSNSAAPAISGKLGPQLSGDASGIQSSLASIAASLGADIGTYSVAIGKRGDYYRVSTSGSAAGATAKHPGADVVYDGKDVAAAVQAALADAIRDGGVAGVSPHVQAALQAYAGDVNKALAEALKAKSLDDLLANDKNPFASAFRDFEDQAKQRLDVASRYGFDVVEIERINAQDRAKLIKQSLDTTVASAKGLLDQLRFGDRAEGSYADRIGALTAERDRVAEAVRGGDSGQLDELSTLAGQLLDLKKDAYGSTAGYAEGRDETMTLIDQLIRQTQDRIDAASKAAQDAQAAPDPQLAELNASADDQVALQQRMLDGIEGLPAAIAGALAGGASRDLGLTYTRAAVA